MSKNNRTDDYWTHRAALRRTIKACTESFLIFHWPPVDVEALHEELNDETLTLDLVESIRDGFKNALNVTSLT